MNRLFATLTIAITMAMFTLPVVAQGTAADSMPETAAAIQTALTDTVTVESADLSTMERLVSFCLEHLNYGTVAMFMAIESSFIPFPSEAVVPPAAWKAATTGDMNIFMVVSCLLQSDPVLCYNFTNRMRGKSECLPL